MNFSPLTFINAKSKRCILSSCLLRLCNSLFELAPRGFVPESECKSTATLPNYQTFCRLFSGNFLRRTARKHAKPHEHSNLYTQKKIQKKYQERRKTTEINGKGKGKKAYAHTPTARNAWDLVSPRAKPQQQSKRKRNPHFGKTTSIIAGTICGLCLNEMRTSFTLPATLRKQGRCRVSGNCAIFGKHSFGFLYICLCFSESGEQEKGGPVSISMPFRSAWYQHRLRPICRVPGVWFCRATAGSCR